MSSAVTQAFNTPGVVSCIQSFLTLEDMTRTKTVNRTWGQDRSHLSLRSLSVYTHPESRITEGYGEYIVYHRKSSGEIVPPSEKIFQTVYSVYLRFNWPNVNHRYTAMLHRIKQIDPSLEITFIPRTLYELTFIKKGIQEDLKGRDFCPNESGSPASDPQRKDCWHIAHFANEENNNADVVKTLAFGMNQNLVKKLARPLSKGTALKFKTIMDTASKQLQFFRKLYDTFDLETRRKNGGFGSSHYTDYYTPGPTILKFTKMNACMRISNEQESQIVLNSVATECHLLAKNAFLLYRGSLYSSDLPFSPQNHQQSYSYSFGAGLFAGALFRFGATPYVYMRESEDGYIVAVPAKDLPESPFVIPQKHTLCQLAADNGVVFHPRTKVWKPHQGVWGFGNFSPGVPEHVINPYYSHLDRETLTSVMLGYKRNNAIFMRSLKSKVLALPEAFFPTVQVHCRVSFGQNLYIRGNGGGLGWEKGKPLVQVGDDRWTYRFTQSFEKLRYKIILDDKQWEEGSNRESFQGTEAAVKPVFTALSPKGEGTRVTVRYDAGPGNFLTMRGAGPGMSWDKGSPLKNIGGNLWIWESAEKFKDFEYKLAINDKQLESRLSRRMKYGIKEETSPLFN